MAEYALLVALLAVGLVAIIGFLQGGLDASFESSGSAVENAL